MKIKFVDGFEIRNTIDTNFGGHFTKNYGLYVPEGEVWIEDYLKLEKDLFVFIAEEEKKAFGKKKGADQIKYYLRIRHRLIEEAKKRGPCPNFVKKISKKGEFKIVYVDGRIVRKYKDPYFISGGHDLVYRFIPKNEIWIDFRNYKKDQPFVVIHELYERKLMAKGMDYDSAHDFALAEERYWRRKKGVARFING